MQSELLRVEIPLSSIFAILYQKKTEEGMKAQQRE